MMTVSSLLSSLTVLARTVTSQDSLEDILDAFDPMQHIEMDEVEMVLKRIQQFEPTGVAARDLSECLLLQLRSMPNTTPWLAEAKKLCAEALGATRKPRLCSTDAAHAHQKRTP